MDIITYGVFELLLPHDPDLFAYTRRYQPTGMPAAIPEELLVICNFSRGERTFTLPERFIGAKVLIANEKAASSGAEAVLGSFGAIVYHIA